MKAKGEKKRGHPIPAEDQVAAREAVAYHFFRLKVIEGLSYPQVAEKETVSLGHAFNLTQEGIKIVARWRDPETQKSDLVVAIARAEHLLAHFNKQLLEAPRNTKIGGLILKVQQHIATMQGLVKSGVEVHNNVFLTAPAVLDRVKQVAGRVVSPLVAEKLPQLPMREAA